jgi:soluble lytic murein transglycosylase
VIRAYQHYFYAQMARQRLAALGNTQAAEQPVSARRNWSFQAPPAPALVENFPTDSPHLAKAHLLANAGLNDYIAQEIAADPDSSSWSALAEAQIYASYGETFRAMRALKRALPSPIRPPSSPFRWPIGGFSSPSRGGRRSRPSRPKTTSIRILLPR